MSQSHSSGIPEDAHQGDPIRLHEALNSFTETWSPRIVAALNDYHFKVARLEGDFPWHSHAETDEAFLVMEGELTIELRGMPQDSVQLSAGDLFVVPKTIEHRPRAAQLCKVLLIEPGGTVNTGDGPAVDDAQASSEIKTSTGTWL